MESKQKFEALLKKVLTVPKTEMQRRLEADKAAKPKPKK